MPKGSYSEHHLIPDTFKGKEKVAIHKICHSKLHSAITEREMEHYYHTIEKLLEHEEIQKFIKWVKKQPDNFYSKNKESKERKRKRQR